MRAVKFEKRPIVYVLLYCGLFATFIGLMIILLLNSFFGFILIIPGLFAIISSFVYRAKDKKIFLRQQNLKAQKHIFDVKNNISPIVEDIFCKHCNGLPIGENSPCRLTIFQDMVYFYCGTMEFKIPMERVISMDIATKSQIEYIQKQSLSRAVAGGLLFGDVGALLGGMPQSKAIEKTESFLVITYRKEEAIQFVTLGNLECNKVLSAVSQYIQFQRKSIQL